MFPGRSIPPLEDNDLQTSRAQSCQDRKKNSASGLLGIILRGPTPTSISDFWTILAMKETELYIFVSDSKHIQNPFVSGYYLSTDTVTEILVSHFTFQLCQLVLGDGVCGKTI